MKRPLFAFFLASVSPFCFAAASDDLRSFARGLQSLTGEFTQQSTSKNGRASKRIEGDFAMARGGKFRWNIHAPHKQALVSDGKVFTSFDADLAQVVEKKLDNVLAGTPLALLTGSTELDAGFEFADEGTVDGIQWVHAKRKQPDQSVSEVRFGFTAGKLVALSWLDAFGQYSALRFSKLSRNPTLLDSTFKFVVPPGVDVVR